MERHGFLYRKDEHTIRTTQIDTVPGCFYYEWIADRETIYLPDGRMHYIWRQDHVEEYHYEVGAIQQELTGKLVWGIAVDPAYRVTKEIEPWMAGMSELDSFEARCLYYERKGLQALYPQIIHPLIQQVVREIERSAGRESIEQIAYRVQYTARQIEKVFRQCYGYGPKRYGQMLRMHKVVDMMREDETITLAQIAYEVGYSDPSHMQREFRKFTGMTPKTFRERYT